MDILRPSRLEDFIGNDKNKSCLEMQIKAAKIKQQPLKHTLFQGLYGSGKTTLANIIAHEMGGNFHNLNAASITKKKHIVELACKIKRGDIVFIDEIHRLDAALEEMLYPIMEDYVLILPKAIDFAGSQQSSFSKIDVAEFTLIGATTDIGLLTGAFLSRFPHHYYVERYSIEDLTKIVKANAIKLKLSLDEDAAFEIAKRSRRIPRIANGRLLWINDYRIAKNISRVSKQNVIDACELKQIDELGLEQNDRRYLSVIDAFRPLGIKSIVAMTQLTEDTITKYIEPYLISIGLVEISPRGRLKIISEEQRLQALKEKEEQFRELEDFLNS